jgi:hypothetical protein
MTVTIYRLGENAEPWVEWTHEGGRLGMVPTLTTEKAERLKANLEAGLEPARAVQEALAPKSPTRAKFPRMGGHAPRRSARPSSASDPARGARALGKATKKGAKNDHLPSPDNRSAR